MELINIEYCLIFKACIFHALERRCSLTPSSHCKV